MRKSERKIVHNREQYEEALEHSSAYFPIYMEKMISAFSKCQAMDRVKLEFLKTFLISLHSALDVTKDPKYVFTLITLYFCHRLSLMTLNFEPKISVWILSVYHKYTRI